MKEVFKVILHILSITLMIVGVADLCFSEDEPIPVNRNYIDTDSSIFQSFTITKQTRKCTNLDESIENIVIDRDIQTKQMSFSYEKRTIDCEEASNTITQIRIDSCVLGEEVEAFIQSAINELGKMKSRSSYSSKAKYHYYISVKIFKNSRIMSYHTFKEWRAFEMLVDKIKNTCSTLQKEETFENLGEKRINKYPNVKVE